jgi:hypothetical protein
MIIFFSHSELLYKQQQNYSSPPPIEIPYYLCIRTSIQTYDIPSLHPKQYKRSSEINAEHAYKEKPLESEYWFAVPKEKYDWDSFKKASCLQSITHESVF